MAKKKKPLWIIRQLKELKQWVGKHKFWAVIASIVVFSLLLSTGQIAVERYNYYRVEKNLENLLSTLPNGDKPDRTIETLKKCSRASAKFSAGQLSCSVRKKTTYQMNEFDNPLKIYPEIFEHFNNNKDVANGSVLTGYGLPSRNLEPHKVDNAILDDISPNFDLKNFKDFGCYLNLKQFGNTLEILVACSRDARVEFFKLSNS